MASKSKSLAIHVHPKPKIDFEKLMIVLKTADEDRCLDVLQKFNNHHHSLVNIL